MTADRPDAWYDDDEVLAAELAMALRTEIEPDGPDPERTAMLMLGYDLVMTDTIEADLTHDSATAELAAVRSGETSERMLTYMANGGLEIEFEVYNGRVTGHVEPANGGQVLLEQPVNAERTVQSAEPDTTGSFEFVLRSPTTFRLRYVDEDGRSVATGWLDGPHPLGR
ncbi:MAG: hypothetical protein AAGA93_09940 [Actinomycetota bacterium]